MFGQAQEEIVDIDDSYDVIFVSDLFVENHVGGAELTSEAIIESSPFKVFKLRSSQVTMNVLEMNRTKFWIFGNYSSMDFNLIPTIISNIRYSIIEYDYKFCKWRSPQKHQEAESKPCDCNEQMNGKIVSAFMHGSESLWWMSHLQMKLYHSLFPFLSSKNNVVLSSVFNERFFEKIQELNKINKDSKKEKWLVVGSESWIKGTDDCEKHCNENQLEYETVWKLSYDNLLEKLSQSKGLVFLPRGLDTCPRLVIEAKLLGCDLVLNENVQHINEPWFKTDNIEKVLTYLYSARSRFWSQISKTISHKPTISGYTTTKDCISQLYPFEASISSMLGFCDQVVIVDGGSTDGTWERLQEIEKENDKILIFQNKRDWTHQRFAVYDGLQKALARSLCTGEFCWQQDSDEVVHEEDFDKVKKLMKSIPKNMDLICLPVIEYWGKNEKVRIDVNPWKWRLSKNRPYITHGIPAKLRKFDESGHLYSLPGSDGCDYIMNDSYDPMGFGTFYTQELDELRASALMTGKNLDRYRDEIESVIDNFPSVYHYSWYNLERKIGTYKNYWSKHWQSLYNISQEDTAENNMFFNKSWSEVTDKEIKDLSHKLEKEMGGWIFHNKVDFSKPTPHIKLKRSHPSFIAAWLKENS